MPEFIEDRKNGFLVGLNVEEYTDKLWWMRRNSEKAKKMGAAARQTVLDGWTWKHAMERERKMLREILS